MRFTFLALIGLMVLMHRRRTAPRVSRVPGHRAGTPLSVGFFVAISAVERLFTTPDTVADAVVDNAGVFPGIGTPAVSVSTLERGYSVRIRYYDSRKSITPAHVKKALETLDPRLRGRISNVKVKRG